jgi:hypothetical protein
MFGKGNVLCLRFGDYGFNVLLPWCVARRMRFVRHSEINVD